MSKNSWIAFIIVIVGVLGGLIVLSKRNTIDTSSVKPAEVQDAKKENGSIGDHVIGSKDAKITIVEYADFQCPGCKSAAQPVKQAITKHKDDVRFIFRNFPLTNIHPNAKAAAAAAEAAGLQGKFFEMHDLLFERSNDWGGKSATERVETFKTYAAEIQLDVKQFEKDIESSKVLDKINYDISLGKKQGVTGTPSLYVNGEVVKTLIKNGKIVDENTEGASQAWSSADNFSKFVIQPKIDELEK